MTRALAIRDAAAVAWLALVAGTALSFWLGADHGLGAGDVATAGVLAIGMTKAWIVGRWFMELGTAPPALRRVFEAWIVVVGAALVVLTLAL